MPLGHPALGPLTGEVRSVGLPVMGEARVRPLAGEANDGNITAMVGCPMRPLTGKVGGGGSPATGMEGGVLAETLGC